VKITVRDGCGAHHVPYDNRSGISAGSFFHSCRGTSGHSRGATYGHRNEKTGFDRSNRMYLRMRFRRHVRLRKRACWLSEVNNENGKRHTDGKDNRDGNPWEEHDHHAALIGRGASTSEGSLWKEAGMNSQLRSIRRLKFAACALFIFSAPLMLVACDKDVSTQKSSTTKVTETPEGTKKTTETVEKKVETEKKQPN
jgi:hypothetical protein